AATALPTSRFDRLTKRSAKRRREPLRPLVRHALDLDLAVDHHVRLHAGPGRRVFAEIALVDGVEAPEVARIIEPDAAAHHVLEAVARFLKDGDEVLDGEMSLLDDAVADDLAILHCHLARNKEPAAGFNGAGEGKVLAPGTGLFGTI